MPIDASLIPLVRGIHIAAGSIALIMAPLAMLASKGGDWHRRWGKAFFYGMAVVCATALILGILFPADFWLAMLAILSFHMVGSGYRSLFLKQMHKGLRPARIDLVLHGVAAVVNGGLLMWGLAHLILKDFNAQALLLTSLGLMGTIMVLNGFMQFYRQRQDKRGWLYGHMIGFMGGYTATLSVFSGVNLAFIEPVWLRWLWPPMVGIPLIWLWIHRLRRRFANGEHLRSFADVRIKGRIGRNWRA
ncbi:MAG: hypothetical protein J5I62_08815 [Flavobacteriales bacterium]|nr:hypothetical protein [Flavobacteriales bacterium]MEB2340720.1 hypothetical protein [Flavobacteriia bacterium]